MNSEKKGAAIGKALLSGPYLIWMAGFTLIPLAMILWYGLTDKGGGLTMANVVKTVIFLADINDFAAVNAEYAKAFTEPFPARSCVQVAAIPKGAKLEIECIAVRG